MSFQQEINSAVGKCKRAMSSKVHISLYAKVSVLFLLFRDTLDIVSISMGPNKAMSILAPFNMVILWDFDIAFAVILCFFYKLE